MLFLISALTLVFNVQPAKVSGTMYIRADGSVDPPDAPISTNDNIVYTLTNNVYASIVVERDNIVIDGKSYMLQGIGSETGISLSGRCNITIKNIKIKAFYKGIVLYESSHNSIYGNIITNNELGIYIRAHPLSSISSQNNIISRNTITNNDAGIEISGSSYNEVSYNKIINNFEGLRVGYWSSGNTIFGNLIGNNGYGTKWTAIGLSGNATSNNNIFHNNFIGNADQVHIAGKHSNVWDNGYPSGGNYWSDYVDRYPDAEEKDASGVWNTPYEIDKNSKDNYPLINPWAPPPLEHEFVTSITAPVFLRPGRLLSLNATVTNEGLNDEVDVELFLLINGTIVDSTTIPILQAGESNTLSFPWNPTIKGTYNVSTYVPPLSEEEIIVNNQDTKFITVTQSVNAGDWIKYTYSYEATPETPYTEWIKIEFLSVEETTVTTCGTMVTMRGILLLSDGTEQNEIFTVNLADSSPWMYTPVFDTLSGFVIFANSTVGDTAWIGNTTGKPCACITSDHGQCFGSKIEGETEKIYVGTLRTVVYAEYSYVIKYGSLTCYWDKQTGVLVEVHNSGSNGWTAKATETNIWTTPPAEEEVVPFWMQWWFHVIVAVVIIALAGAVYLFLKKKKLPTPTSSTSPAEGV